MLLTRGGQSYTNDAAGNTLTGGGRTMTWDAQNRMVTCSYGGVTSTFTYGADGLRRRMVVGSNVTDYVLDGQNVVQEIRNGQVEAFYLWGPRGPEYRRDAAGNVEWYLYDGLGSIVATVGSSGTVLDTRKYDVYGAVRSGGVGTRHRFVGQLGHTSDDEIGLLYMRARYYDPAVGRFVSEDPAGCGANWLAYCGSNPTNGTDPSGCFTLPEETEAVAEAIGLDSNEGAALTRFVGWALDQIETALAKKNLSIIVEFVEGESGGYAERIGTDMLIRLGSGGRNLETLLHEMGELVWNATSRKGMHMEITPEMLAVFRSFLPVP